jgi:hypothetical protein
MLGPVNIELGLANVRRKLTTPRACLKKCTLETIFAFAKLAFAGLNPGLCGVKASWTR